ncbi:MAG TPA: sodium:proton antiporter [Aestuariivirga sp.]|nr:sodium:proton antiporter [Aestuariivirga sp.]
MTSVFDLTALLLTLSAAFGWLNYRFVRLPHTIGITFMGLIASLLLLLVEILLPNERIFEDIENAILHIDFADILMDGMLAFLLFAGALTVDLNSLRNRALPVAFLAFAGTALSTVIMGAGFWWLAGLAGVSISFLWALVFGALISPTDPVAVLSTLKTARIPAPLRVEIQGESLFNDGMGIVLFTFLVGLAAGGSAAEFDVNTAVLHLVIEAGGGLVLGVCTGYIAYLAIRAIDDFSVEVLITLALVTGTYAVAKEVGLSGPLAMVSAGLLIGHRGPKYAMSEKTQTYVWSLWTLIDEILNSVLFLLIGLEVLVLNVNPDLLFLALAGIPLALASRFIAVATPHLVYRTGLRQSGPRALFQTWAGVRGGISIALVLSLPGGDAKQIILAATYAIVIFTVIIQGATLQAVARRLFPAESGQDADTSRQSS